MASTPGSNVGWRLYQIAGKIVFHGEQVFLKVRRGLCQLFVDIRLRIWEFANTQNTSQESGFLKSSGALVCPKHMLRASNSHENKEMAAMG